MLSAAAGSVFFTAYIGPGAGFVFMGSFFILLAAFFLVIAAVLSWPFRALLSLVLRKGKKRGKAKARRVIVVGLDGLDPRRCRRLMDEGKMPAMKKMADQGSFSKLESSCPPISPVAWSTFMTGCNPGKHNIFDFLNRNPRNYALELSSSRISTTRKGKPVLELLRKSKPFWCTLGEYGLFSTILRVPITFPAENFRGLCISGMCVPDLRGSQGSFTCFTTEKGKASSDEGQFVEMAFDDKGVAQPLLSGPSVGSPERTLQISIRVRRLAKTSQVELTVCKQTYTLSPGDFTPWVEICFKGTRFQKIHGICRFSLRQLNPETVIYCTPINIDPARPSLPVGSPGYYSIYLSKLIGRFSTLGLAEDTWAMNEGILDDDGFLRQTYDVHAEREAMFFEALKRTKRGVCACVFDGSDRIQHMFTRHGDTHESVPDEHRDSPSEKVLDDMYGRMDRIIDRVQSMSRKGDVIMVLSDHGFTSFRRGIQLNAWLKEQGYLVEKDPNAEGLYLTNIDWKKTRAYAFGLSGIYFNLQNREGTGVVLPEDAPALKKEIAEKLCGLTDPETGSRVVHKVHPCEDVYDGPYRENGPDLVVGYCRDYRISWDGATGRTNGPIFTDNTKAWSGDHCVDTELVPGVLVMNRKLEEADPRLMDIGPTVLDLFGVPVPRNMDGKALHLKDQQD